MVRAVLTDIEGTTSSISFVHEVLFPFARERMRDFVAANRADESVARHLEEALALAADDSPAADAVEVLLGWMDQDRKATPLKAIQGLIWAQGYASGELKGHLYEDAHRNLVAWHERGLPLYIFSSGSVRAQKLLFGHSVYGDLCPLFLGYFDTTTGPKGEADSYRAIASAMDCAIGEILFLSDVAGELDAAGAAGMQTAQLVRDSEVVLAPEHRQVKSFDELGF